MLTPTNAIVLLLVLVAVFGVAWTECPRNPCFIPCQEPPQQTTVVCDYVCVNGMNLKYTQTLSFSCEGVAIGQCVFTSVEGCCKCDTNCMCCSPDNPCPWWLCLWWPCGYCTGNDQTVQLFSEIGSPSCGVAIPLMLNINDPGSCKWISGDGTVTFSSDPADGGTLVFSPGNQFGCATYANPAPWDCESPYTVKFVSSSAGSGCNACGNWPPTLTLYPSPAGPLDADPCNVTGSGASSGSGSAQEPCCSPNCPTPPEWRIVYHLTACPTGGSTPGCGACVKDSPSEIDVTFSGMSGAYACFNGNWKIFGDPTVCDWADSVGPGSPDCSITVNISGVPGNWTWVVQPNSNVLTNPKGCCVAVYQFVVNHPAIDCCSPVTLPLNFADADGASPTITINPVCGDGTVTNIDCDCTVALEPGVGCCWEGPVTGLKKPNTGANVLCLVENPDGTLSWVLKVLLNGSVVAVYEQNIGTEEPCCCDDFVLSLVSTTCAGASPFIYMTPLGAPCEGTGSASGTGSGTGSNEGGPISNSCCPGGVPQEMFLTINGGGAGEECNCLNGTYPMLWNGGQWTTSVSSPLTLCGRQVIVTLDCVDDPLLCGPPTPWILVITDVATGNTTSVCGTMNCSSFIGTFTFPGAIESVCDNIDFTPIVCVVMS